MSEKKQGWFEIPPAPNQPIRYGYFVNGKLQAWAYADGTWILFSDKKTGAASSVDQAKQLAEAAVWEE